MSEFNYVPDMDDPKPANDFESNFDDATLDLFNEYGNQITESLEEFANRMFNRFGENWRVILGRPGRI